MSGVDTRRVARLWWPLAASWLLMAAELPLVNAIIARLPDEELHLAAYGSVVFPISLVIEGPIIMLLAASTALCGDRASYRRVHRFMMASGALLSAIHVAVAFTPLYDVVVGRWMGVPDDVLETARTGLRIMTPWTWAIAYRRFQQGVLIRRERSREVGVGTLVRLVANASALAIGATVGGTGIVVAASAVAFAVVAEAVYIGWRVRPVVRELPVEATSEPLSVGSFVRFYAPLATTPLITLFIQPIGTSAMTRMPETTTSLAAWPVVHALVFLTRAPGMAYNEVVVALVGQPGAVRALRRFHTILGLATMGVLALLAATPLAGLWFEVVSDLPPALAATCRAATALAIVMPGYEVLRSWYTGALVAAKRTRAVTEAVVLYFTVCAVLLVIGGRVWTHAGVYFAIGSFVAAGLLQTGWLAWRSRDAIRRHAEA